MNNMLAPKRHQQPTDRSGTPTVLAAAIGQDAFYLIASRYLSPAQVEIAALRASQRPRSPKERVYDPPTPT